MNDSLLMAENTLIPPVSGNVPVNQRKPDQKSKRGRDDHESGRKPERNRNSRKKGRRIDEFA